MLGLVVGILGIICAHGLKAPNPVMNIKLSTTSTLEITVGSDIVIPDRDTFSLKRRGINGRTALRRCGDFESTGTCPNGPKKFVGAIYSAWMTEPSFACNSTSFVASPYKASQWGTRACYYLSEACSDIAGWVDGSGLGCSWYSDATSRCENNEDAQMNCCSCQGGNVTTTTLVQCASDRGTCTLPNSMLNIQGGVWVYWGALQESLIESTVESPFFCDAPYVYNPLSTSINADRFCFYADSWNARNFTEISTAGVDTNWVFHDDVGTPLMYYNYKIDPISSSTYNASSDIVPLVFAPAPAAPVVISIGNTVTGRLSYSWTVPKVFARPISYRIYMDGELQDETGVTTWTFVDCKEGIYYDMKVIPVALGVAGNPSAIFGRYCGDIPSPPKKPELLSVSCDPAVFATPSIRFKWQPPKESGTFAITSYRFLRAEQPDDFSTPWSYRVIDPVTGVSPDQQEFSDEYSQDLVVGKVYRYRVFATNGVDDSDLSNASPFLAVRCN